MLLLNAFQRPKEWGDSNFQIFLVLPVAPEAAGVIGTFNCCILLGGLYHSGILSTMVTIFGPSVSHISIGH